MAPRPALILLVALLFPLAGLAGCIGKDKPPVEDDTGAMNQSNVTPTSLPDGREFAAAKETNNTVSNETLDGKMHMHDYWHGKETVTIYEDDVSIDLTPVFERGDNTKVWEAFINLEKLPDGSNLSALIYEGTGKVTFLITEAPQWSTTFSMTFRTAGKDWTPWQNIGVGTPFEYLPAKTETDMPHSIRSLWNWKLQASGPVAITGDGALGFFEPTAQPIHVQIIVTKAASVDDWPPHPDFYGGVQERVVMLNMQGKTDVANAVDVLIYGVEPDQLVPEKLVSMGTEVLDVYVNITELTLPPGVPNGGFTLYWRNANTTPDALGVFSIANETDKQTNAYFHLNIDHGVVDSPYQPTSRFAFKILANALDDSVVACYRCMPYTITYTMTIIARPSASAEDAEMLPP